MRVGMLVSLELLFLYFALLLSIRYGKNVSGEGKANEGYVLGIWTQLALAYAIHKSFIFIRVPLTVAVTPKVVKVLRGWGWDIGKRRPKGVK